MSPDPLPERELFRIMFDAAGPGMAQVDPHSRRILRVNAAFRALTGYDERALLGMSVDDLDDPADRRPGHHTLAALLRDGAGPVQTEKRYLRQDGSTVWVQETSNVVCDDEGLPLFIMVVSHDLTSRKKEESAVRARLAALAEATRALTAAGPNPDAVLTEVARQAAQHVGDLAVVRLLSGDGLWLEPAAVDHADPLARTAAAAVLARERHPADRGANGAALRLGRPQRLTEEGLVSARQADGPELWPPLVEAPTAVLLAAPLRANGRAIGTLSVSRQAADRIYDEEDERFVQELADRAGLAIERARLFARVQASERLLRLAVEANRMVVWEWDPVADQVTTSGNVGEIYGVAALTGMGDVLALLWPEDLPHQQRNLSEIARRGGEYRAEFRITRPVDGTVAWLEERATALTGADGQGTKVMGVTTDVTARKAVESMLHRQAQLIDLSHEPIVVWSFDHGIVEWNAGAEQLYGYGEAEALGQVSHELLRTIHPIPHAAIIEALLHDGEWTGELRHTTRDGREVVVESRQQAITIDGRQLILETNRDVTARKQAEADREALLDALAHDLRNPLTTLLLQVQILQRRVLRQGLPEQDILVERLAGFEALTIRMATLLGELGDQARVTLGGEIALNRRRTDLGGIVRDVMEGFEVPGGTHTLRFQVEETGLIGIWDPDQLRRVVENLLSNAVKYSPAGGRVEIRLGREGTAATLAVRDEGIGIPAVDLPYIFERFRRGSNVGAIEGSGIGLAGLKQIVEHHGGAIAVQSDEGAGSTFTVYLPLDRS